MGRVLLLPLTVFLFLIRLGMHMVKEHFKAILEQRVQIISVKKINKILKESNPTAFTARKNDNLDKTNPTPYFSPSFGYKGHIDQNEKLVRYGVVHAVFRDGFSGSIKNWITPPSKNPIQLYSQFYRYVI